MVASEGTPLLRVGDVDCPTVEDAHFSAVRRAFGIADDFLAGVFDFGALRWQLVGAPIPDRASMLSDFELRSVDGALEDFMGQHDANLLPDGTLTMFDNRQYPLETSRMIDVSLDDDARVATVTHTYDLGVKCPFQGGARMTRSGGRLATCASSRTVYGFGPGESESRWSLSVSCADMPAGPAYILRVHPVEI